MTDITESEPFGNPEQLDDWRSYREMNLEDGIDVVEEVRKRVRKNVQDTQRKSKPHQKEMR